jgi:hypothetical protein
MALEWVNRSVYLHLNKHQVDLRRRKALVSQAPIRDLR